MRLPKLSNLEKYFDPNNEEDLVKLKYIPKTDIYDTDWKNDPKALVNIIRKIETYIRSSYEFKRYLKYLKESLELNQCLFLPNAGSSYISNFKTELHHGPYTLFDITTAVFNKQFNQPDTDLSKCSFWKVANEVTRLHYEMKVGLVPLCITAHQLVHSGDIFIPLDCYFGDYEKFEVEYDKYIPEDIKSMAKLQRQLTEKFKLGALKPDSGSFKKIFTYLEIDGMEYPHIEDKNTKEELSKNSDNIKDDDDENEDTKKISKRKRKNKGSGK